MNNIVIFTEQSLYSYIFNHPIKELKNAETVLQNCIRIFESGNIYIFSLSTKDMNFSKETLIVFKNIDELLSYSEENLQELFSRIHKYSHAVNRKNNKLIPHSWSPYRYKNKVSFFAFDDITLDNSKVIIEIKDSLPNNILIHGLTNGKSFSIENYTYSESEYEGALKNIQNAFTKFKEEREEKKILEMGDDLRFESTIFNEDKIYSYDEWIRRLSKVQNNFVFVNKGNAIKLRGPAGTGKTLAMEMKAIKLLKDNADCKVLFLTHSWTTADYVQNFIEQIVLNDELKRIDIFPLLSFAEMFITHNNNLIILGDDSFSGKLEQLKIIEELVKDYKLSNMALYEKRVSEHFLQYIATEDINFEKSFYWDLMIEFACVIGANGIMPGIAAKEKYLRIERRPWMMTLLNDADKEFVISIYQEYIKYLMEHNNITSDQIINDYLIYLSTYNWHYDRTARGYDYIFIDEMQLFNEQERMVLHYLTKNPDVYPILYMAMDPRQTITETYFDYGIKNMANIVTGEISDSTFGQYDEVMMGEVFRYTKEILNFLKHIDKSYPALGLDSEWENNIKRALSKKSNGDLPMIYLANSVNAEISYIFDQARNYSSKGLRIAVLALSNDSYILLKKKFSSEKVIFIESKEDTIKLQYKKRGIIISQPFYVIGLQFDVVIISGCYIHFDEHDRNQMYNLRRFISDVYLGAGRASKHLLITSNITIGSIPGFINNAVEKKYLVKLG
jgi:hypothetical protein